MMEHREGVRPYPSPPPRPTAAQIRTVWDADAGREWRVWRTDCRDVPGARSNECLIFDSGTTVRRVWAPPVGWSALSDEDLLALVNTRPER